MTVQFIEAEAPEAEAQRGGQTRWPASLRFGLPHFGHLR